MRVQDVMNTPAITCHVNDTLQTAAVLMWDHDCGVIAVINDDGKVTGVITDRDICMGACTQNRPLDAILVNTAMAHSPITVTPDHKLDDVERLMADRQIRRLPVVDASGAPLGMLSLNDLAIESVEPDTRMKNGPVKVAYTLAAICRRRSPKKKAA
ncbi:MAG TPA: CBS domain-containing protein [Kofleriaceae bacterium]|nr:CBS domain-containing protein [Kofleriaceae bacterium]